MREEVLTTVDGTVAVCRMNRPEVRNALSPELMDQLATELERLDGDKKQAAQTLGISLKTLYNRLNRYGLGRSKVRSWSG